MESIGKLYEELHPRLLAHLRSQGASTDEAEDAISAAFEVLVVESNSGNTPDSNAVGFLYTVAKRQLYRIWNSQRKVTSIESAEERELAVEDPNSLEESLEYMLATRAFLRLDADERELLWATVANSVSQKDIAREQGVPAATVRKRASRARLHFRELYLAAYAEGNHGDECQHFIPLLSREALGRTSLKQRRQLKQHLKSCESCSLLSTEITDEAAYIRKLPGVVFPTAGIAHDFQFGRVGHAATQASSRRALGWLTFGGGLAALVIVLMLFGISRADGPVTALVEPTPNVPETKISPSPNPEEPTEKQKPSAETNLQMTPELIQLSMPAPGHEISWTISLTNNSSMSHSEIDLFTTATLSTQQSTGIIESPLITVSSNKDLIQGPLPLTNLDRKPLVKIILAPRETRAIRVVLSRSHTDSDESLGGEIRVGASSFVKDDSKINLPLVGAVDEDVLAKTGVAGAGGLLIIGLFLIVGGARLLTRTA